MRHKTTLKGKGTAVKKARYFYVVYWTTLFPYNSQLMVSYGGYLNKKEFERSIANSLPGIKPMCMIINVIELNEKDYNDFTREYAQG